MFFFTPLLISLLVIPLQVRRLTTRRRQSVEKEGGILRALIRGSKGFLFPFFSCPKSKPCTGKNSGLLLPDLSGFSYRAGWREMCFNESCRCILKRVARFSGIRTCTCGKGTANGTTPNFVGRPKEFSCGPEPSTCIWTQNEELESN